MIRLIHYTLAAALIGTAALSASVDPDDVYTLDEISGPFGAKCAPVKYFDGAAERNIWEIVNEREGDNSFGKSGRVARICLEPDAPLSRAILAAAMGITEQELKPGVWDYFNVAFLRSRSPIDTVFVVRPDDPNTGMGGGAAAPIPLPGALLLLATGFGALAWVRMTWR